MKNQIFDVLIIGAGGSGLFSAITAAKKGLHVALISRTSSMQSNTAAAQGGINAALGNISEDDVNWHIYDTLKAADWIADEDSVSLMCNKAPVIISMLDDIGVEFNRNEDGKIDQKVYGGQSTNFGQGNLAKRACYSKDKTGQAIMDKLYVEAKKHDIEFFNFHFALDLIINNNRCCGASCIDLKTGEVKAILALNTIIATGGYSQIYHNTTTASICSGDGMAMIARCGLPLQDMEFVQFHPTALHGAGVLITEAARSCGGRLLNGNKERFMQKYAPKFMELAPRDIVARAIATEISEGRGAGINKDHIYLDLTHLSVDYIKEQLPNIYENCQNFDNISLLAIDPSKDLIPISPASHYTMGGIPTDNFCRVVADAEGNIACDGLYAIGEVASISVHGANRLGCNSLLDLLVFAQVAIEHIHDNICKQTHEHIHESRNKNILQKINTAQIVNYTKERLDSLLKNTDKCGNIQEATEYFISSLTERLKKTMSKNVQLFRNEELLQEALTEIQQIKKIYTKLKVAGNLIWNIALIEYIELGNLLITAEATTIASLWRKESRGCHYRSDFPKRDNQFKVHSLTWLHNKKVVAKKVRTKEDLAEQQYKTSNSLSEESKNVYFFQDEQRNY